ncbi:unnamed protein product [Peniophora sp. CBMAI 1063]|nr:unnamed protein product [Peniophora sp. CBMAI 1063]
MSSSLPLGNNPKYSEIATTTPWKLTRCGPRSPTSVDDSRTRSGPHMPQSPTIAMLSHVLVDRREWQGYADADGHVYYTQGERPRTITDADMKDSATAQYVDAYAGVILARAKELDLTFGPRIELFIEVDDHDVCRYYFADHTGRTLFWLDGDPLALLGLSSVCKRMHLKLILEDNYWKHVEMFSLHLPSLGDALDELFLIHWESRAELATPSKLVFYFSPEEMKTRLEALAFCRSLLSNPTTFALVASLWGSTIRAKLTYLGHDCAHVLVTRSGEGHTHSRDAVSVMFCLVSFVLFGLPKDKSLRLICLYRSGALINKTLLEAIINPATKKELFTQGALGIVNLPGSLAALGLPPFTTLTYVSLLLSFAGLLLSVLLQARFDSDSPKNYRHTRAFFQALTPRKIAALAIVLSLPRAIFIWTVVLFAVQCALAFYRSVPLYLSLPLSVGLLCIAGADLSSSGVARLMSTHAAALFLYMGHDCL